METSRRIKPRLSAPVQSEEQPFQLPMSWQWGRLSDVGYELGQKVPDTPFSYIDVGSIDSEKGRISERVETVEPEDAPSRARKVIKHDTVIYSTVRPYLLNVAVVDQQFENEPIASTAFGILHPFNGISSRYLFYWLRSESFTRYVEQGMKGMAYPAINDEKLYNGYIPIPPEAEQSQIVNRVDELMALCDRLEAQLQERDTRQSALAGAALARFAEAPTPANLEFLFHDSFTVDPADLRNTILCLAVRGKLLPQDPTDESAETAIQRIGPLPLPARYNKRSTARVQGIAALSIGPRDGEVPKGWVSVPLVQIARIESGHTPSRSRPDWWGGEIRWVGVVDARLHDGKTIYETRQHTNGAGLANSAARLLPSGTVCVSRTASVGYVVVLGRPMATSQDFVNWVPSEAVTSEWLRLVFTAEKEGFDRFSKGAVHQTIYYHEWLSMHTLLPPLTEQRRIAARVDQLMALVDQLEARQAAARETGEKLLDAMIAELLANSSEPRRKQEAESSQLTHL